MSKIGCFLVGNDTFWLGLGAENDLKSPFLVLFRPFLGRKVYQMYQSISCVSVVQSTHPATLRSPTYLRLRRKEVKI